MANRDNPNGFNFVSINAPYPPLKRVHEKQAGQATAIFQNDVVHFVGGVTGFNRPPVEPFGTGTPGTTIPGGVSTNYGPALTRTRHSVYVDPRAEYHAQDDGDTDGLAAVDMNKNALVSVGAGSVLTGYSGHEIDEAGITTSGSAADLRLIGLWDEPLNAFGSAHVRVLVKFLRMRETAGSAGI